MLLFFLSCNKENETQKPHYENQIGDTPFDPALDRSDFKLCDSTNVIHKRALVTYKGGIKALEKELIKNYNSKTEHSAFTGYFIIRFVINCNNESGRYRLEVLDSSFQSIEAPKALENHVLESFKKLKRWNHAVYEGKDYDCYKFVTLKMIKGQLIKS